MKQKEQWAKEDVMDKLWTLGDGQSQYYPEKCWLAGFDFAKKQCADHVCNCCDNQEFCRDLGEEDSEKDQAEKLAAQQADGVRDEKGRIIPVSPIGVGVEKLEDN